MLLTIHEHLGSPQVFGGVLVALLVSFLCCLFFPFFFLLYLSSSCVSSVYNLPLSLDCPFSMADSVFSNVYLLRGGVGPIKLVEPSTYYWSGITKPYKWSVIYLCVRCIDCASFYHFAIWFWNCSESVVYFCNMGDLIYLLLLVHLDQRCRL